MDHTAPHLTPPHDCELEGVSFSQMQATHVKRRGQPVWTLPIQTSLGHVSGRLPSKRDECWQAWHWPGQSMPKEDLPLSVTWARLSQKARKLKAEGVL